MAEKRNTLAKSTARHVYGNVKEYLATVAAPISLIICWGVESAWKIDIPAGVEIAIVAVFAGLGAKMGTNTEA